MQPANYNTLNAARYKDALDIQVDSEVCDVGKWTQVLCFEWKHPSDVCFVPWSMCGFFV